MFDNYLENVDQDQLRHISKPKGNLQDEFEEVFEIRDEAIEMYQDERYEEAGQKYEKALAKIKQILDDRKEEEFANLNIKEIILEIKYNLALALYR